MMMRKAGFAISICLIALSFSSSAFGKKAKGEIFPFERDGKAGYVDVEGRVVIEPKFNFTRKFVEGLAAVQINDKWGFIDKSGLIVINPRFDEVSDFSEGLAAVGNINKNSDRIEKYGYINAKGQYVIKPQFATASDFSEGLAQIESVDEQQGYVDKEGKVFYLDSSFSYSGNFSEGLAVVDEHGAGGKSGYINKMGHVVMSPIYETAHRFSDGLACVSIDRKFGFIDARGDFIIGARFDGCSSFSEGLAAVKVGQKWGYINKTGAVVIKPKFIDAQVFSEGLAAVSLLWTKVLEKTEEAITAFNGEMYGFIDRTGKLVLKPQFSQVSQFHSGLALVNLSDETSTGLWEERGYINKSGKLIWKNIK
jgi:hypothetical protein